MDVPPELSSTEVWVTGFAETLPGGGSCKATGFPGSDLVCGPLFEGIVLGTASRPERSGEGVERLSLKAGRLPGKGRVKGRYYLKEL